MRFIIKKNNAPFNDNDLTILEGLAASAAIAIENSLMISEQISTEERLQETEAKYRTVVEQSIAGVYLIQEEGFTYVNPKFAEMHGYTPEEMIGMSPIDVVHPDDKELVASKIRHRLSGELQEAHYTLRVCRKDGAIRYTEVFGSRSELHGKPVIIGTSLDITERKRAEEAIRLNEERLEALLKLSQMTDTTLEEIADFALQKAVDLTRSKLGYLAFVNEDETTLNMFAWSESARKMCSIPDKPLVYAIAETGLWGEAIRQRKPIVTNDYLAPNPFKKGVPEGHVLLTRHMNVPIFAGGHIVAVAGVGNKDEEYDDSDVRQLTLLMDGMWKLLERNRSALEIKESEERFRFLFEHNPEVVALYRNKNIVAASPSIVQFLGYEPQEITGISPPEVNPEYQPNGLLSKEEAARHMEDAISNGPQHFEWTHIHKNGSLVYGDVTLAAYTVRGETYMQSITRDITEKKRAEEERRQFERQVEAQKRLFYRETILSVTEGKLEICDPPDIEPYITQARLKSEVKGPAEVSPARVEAEEFCKKHGLEGDKLDAFAIAIGEAITNSVKHGGEGAVYAGLTDDSVWVAASDKGKGIESLILPRATLLRGFSTKPSLGLGYSIMLDVSDRILLNTGEQGTTVILIKNTAETELTLSPNRIPDTWENIPGI